MLSTKTEKATERAYAVSSNGLSTLDPSAHADIVPDRSGALRSRLAAALRIEWLGQTAASLCWIASVLAYGISSTGDWLQLFAASSWLLANIAALATAEAG